MDSWQVKVTSEAEEDIERLDGAVRSRILAKLKWLRENFDNVVPFTPSIAAIKSINGAIRNIWNQNKKQESEVEKDGYKGPRFRYLQE